MKSNNNDAVAYNMNEEKVILGYTHIYLLIITPF